MLAPETQLGSLMARRQAAVNPASYPDEIFDLFSIPAFDKNEPDILLGSEIGSAKKTVEPGDVLLSRIVPHIRRAWVVPKADGRRQIASSEWIVFRSKEFFPPYLRYYLTSDQFHSKFMNTVAGVGGSLLRARPDQVAQFSIKLPSLSEQKRIASILDKAEVIRRKRHEAKVLWENMLRSAYITSFGDPVTNPKGWPMSEIGKIADMVTGYAFKSVEYVNDGVRLCRGANVMPDLLDWSDVRYWRPNDASIDSRLHLIKDDVVLAMDRPWISTGIKVAQVTEDDLPAYLVQRVSRLRGKGRISNAFLFYSLRHPAFTAHCGGLKTETTVPHISPQDIRSFPIPVAPDSVHDEFERLAQQAKHVTRKLELAANESNHLFNSLVQRAFKGEL